MCLIVDNGINKSTHINQTRLNRKLATRPGWFEIEGAVLKPALGFCVAIQGNIYSPRVKCRNMQKFHI